MDTLDSIKDNYFTENTINIRCGNSIIPASICCTRNLCEIKINKDYNQNIPLATLNKLLTSFNKANCPTKFYLDEEKNIITGTASIWIDIAPTQKTMKEVIGLIFSQLEALFNVIDYIGENND